MLSKLSPALGHTGLLKSGQKWIISTMFISAIEETFIK